MRRDCITEGFSRGFYSYGKFVVRHPWPFVIVPVVLSVVLVLGMLRMRVTSDLEYLYVPVNAPGKVERQRVESNFMYNEHEFYSSIRRTRIGGLVRVLVIEKNRQNIFTDSHLRALFELDDFIKNVTARYKRDTVTYSEVCAKWHGECADIENTFLAYMRDRTVDEVQLKYPMHLDNYERLRLSLGMQISQPEFDSDGFVSYFEAIGLAYNVQHEDASLRDRATAWTRELTHQLLKYPSDKFDVSLETFETIELELEKAIYEVIPMFTATFIVLGLFAFGSLLMRDWVRGKPFIASAGMIAACLGAASGMGLLIAAGTPFNTAVGAVPFLIIGTCHCGLWLSVVGVPSSPSPLCVVLFFSPSHLYVVLPSSPSPLCAVLFFSPSPCGLFCSAVHPLWVVLPSSPSPLCVVLFFRPIPPPCGLFVFAHVVPCSLYCLLE